MCIVKRLNNCTDCSLCARLGTGDSQEVRHSSYHWETHRLLGKSIGIKKNMVNALRGLSLGALGPRGAGGRGWDTSGDRWCLWGQVGSDQVSRGEGSEFQRQKGGQGQKGVPWNHSQVSLGTNTRWRGRDEEEALERLVRGVAGAGATGGALLRRLNFILEAAGSNRKVLSRRVFIVAGKWCSRWQDFFFLIILLCSFWILEHSHTCYSFALHNSFGRLPEQSFCQFSKRIETQWDEVTAWSNIKKWLRAELWGQESQSSCPTSAANQLCVLWPLWAQCLNLWNGIIMVPTS